jgi:hypothetical protein
LDLATIALSFSLYYALGYFNILVFYLVYK